VKKRLSLENAVCILQTIISSSKNMTVALELPRLLCTMHFVVLANGSSPSFGEKI